MALIDYIWFVLIVLSHLHLLRELHMLHFLCCEDTGMRFLWTKYETKFKNGQFLSIVKTETSLDFNNVKPCFDLFQFQFSYYYIFKSRHQIYQLERQTDINRQGMRLADRQRLTNRQSQILTTDRQWLTVQCVYNWWIKHLSMVNTYDYFWWQQT